MHKLHAAKLSTKKATTIDPPPSLPPPKYQKHQTPPPPPPQQNHTQNNNNNTQKQHTNKQTTHTHTHTHTWKSLFTRFVTLHCNIPAVICLTTPRVTILLLVNDYALSTRTWSVYQQQTVHQQTQPGLFISNRQYISKLSLVAKGRGRENTGLTLKTFYEDSELLLWPWSGLKPAIPIFSQDNHGHDVPQNKVWWLQMGQQSSRYGRNRHNIYIWIFTVTLILKTANQLFSKDPPDHDDAWLGEVWLQKVQQLRSMYHLCEQSLKFWTFAVTLALNMAL